MAKIGDIAKMQRETAQRNMGNTAAREQRTQRIAQQQPKKDTLLEIMLSTGKGAAKTAAGAYTNVGGMVLSGVKAANDSVSSEQAKAQQEQKNADHYRAMLARGTMDDGSAIDSAQAARLTMLAQRAEKKTQIYLDALDNSTKEIQGAATSAYRVADRLSASGEKDIAKAKSNTGAVGDFIIDLGVTGTQMAADMGAAALTGGSALPLMELRSFGGASQEARQSGASFGQQMAYGAGSAALGVATERIANVAGPFKKMYGEGVLEKVIPQVVSRLTKTAAGKLALSALSEGGEEFIEDVFQPVLKRATGVDRDASFDLEGALYDAAIGGVLGGIGGGVDAVQGRKRTKQAVQGAGAGAETPQAVRAETDTAEGKAAQSGVNMPVSVGRVTTIQSLYQGETPIVSNKSTVIPQISADDVGRASSQIAAAEEINRSLHTGTAAALKQAVSGVFVPKKNIPVFGTSFAGNPYTVDVNKSIVNKIISQYASPESLAVLNNVETIVQNGEFVGSGNFQKDGKRNKNTLRFDYFETPITIAGKDYVVSFDVEAFPNVNNYKTHRVYNMELSEMPSAVTGQYPAANGTQTVPTGTIPQTNRNINTNSDGLGAAEAGSLNSDYDRLQAQSDTFYPEGANAARPVDVPTTDANGNPVSKSSSTVMGAQAIPDEVVPMLEQMVADGKLSYTKKSDARAVANANSTMRDIGFDGAMERFRSDVNSGKVSKDTVALGQTLLNNAANSKDGKAVAELMCLYQTMSTNTAQSMQAMSIFRKLSPENQLYGIQKTVAALDSKLQKTVKDYGGIDVNSDLISDFLAQTDQDGRNAVMEKIYDDVASQVPSTWRDKWNAWRYLSMLANPRTHVRNIVGNVGFQPMRIIKNEVAAAIESGLSAAGVEVERTKSFGVSPALYRAAWKDFENAKDVLGGTKFEDAKGQIDQRRRIFENSVLEGARKKNYQALEAEDAIFKRITYADSLAGYLKANGVTAAQVESGSVDASMLAKARSYAGQEALKATYQDKNGLSDLLSSRFQETSGWKTAANVVGDAVMPFKRTPANILARALEYSPAGLAKSLTVDLKKVASGDMTAAQAIDNVASGLTGSALLGLGAYLAAQGLVRGGAGDDKEDKWAKLLGHQNYALELPDGTSVTLDWLSPEALPFFMGVELMGSIGENGFTAASVWDALKSTANPMLELSMLQSVNDLVESAKYAEGNSVPAMIGSAVVSYFSQAVPTIGGQLERTSENTRMMTYTDKNSAVPKDLQYALGRASSRIPGWDYQQTEYIDQWGRTESTGDPLVRAAQNFLNPAYTSKVEVDAVERELQAVADKTGNTNVFPKAAARAIDLPDGTTKNLTAEEYTRYAKALGAKRYTLVKEAQKLPGYKRLDAEGKADMVSTLYEYANALAKTKVSSYKLSDEMVKYQKAEKSGVSAAEYYLLATGADTDGNGSKSQKEVKAYLGDSSFTKTQKADLWKLMNKAWKTNPYN